MEDQRRSNLTFGLKGCRSGLEGFTNQNSRMVPQLDGIPVKLNICKCKYKYLKVVSDELHCKSVVR